MSVHPLAGESDTGVDERLIGWWASRDEGPNGASAGQRFVVGRHSTEQRGMELCIPSLDRAGRLDVARLSAYALSLDGRDCLSVIDADVGVYWICRYVAKEDGSIDVFNLNGGPVMAAIKAGDIDGLMADPEGAWWDAQSLITARPEELRAWISANAETCFSLRSTTFFRVE